MQSEPLVRLAAPANLLILGGEEDDRWSADIAEMVQYARPAFVNGVLEYGVNPGGHHFSAEMCARAYAFLHEHLV
ncbi:MAG: hypothetical protein R2911_33090 [Caldilineaceae bacterium]